VRLIREGARAERIRAARADVVAARAAVGGAKSAVGELVLVSPVEGIVLARHAEPGEVLPAGIPAMTIGDLRRPFVRVYVATPALPGISIGDSVDVGLDGRKERFRGRVVAIDSKAQFTPRIALTEEERADLLFGVKVDLPPSDVLKPGLPATVRFEKANRPAAR
jgi:HlyD family secretion protein